ncbi:uncharacterized protein LOC130719515 [Lotus japonicus]|uniref:uncharacterized protein LOC130719515 n=1 Tax=Lotus japonicus TaxID=34305 RepID=UPI00258F5E76|nr:uncharacterized protein LOC130719515 [Lotus japonicus]
MIQSIRNHMFTYVRKEEQSESDGGDILLERKQPPEPASTTLQSASSFWPSFFWENFTALPICIQCSSSSTSLQLLFQPKCPLHLQPPKGIDPSSDVFHCIQMKYVNDDEDIRKYFAAFHLLDTLPAAVVIDDFGDFFDNK